MKIKVLSKSLRHHGLRDKIGMSKSFLDGHVLRLFERHWIFICYRRGVTGNSLAASLISSDLRAAFGNWAVYRDLEKQEVGNWNDNLLMAIKRSRVLLILIDEVFAKQVPDLHEEDDFVRREVSAALNQPDVTVICLLHNGQKMPTADELPADLRRLPEQQAYQLMDLSWPEQMGRVVERMRPFRARGELWPLGLLGVGAMLVALTYLEATCAGPIGFWPGCISELTIEEWWQGD